MPYKVGIVFRDGKPVTYDSGDYPTCQATALDSRRLRRLCRAPGDARASKAAISASASATRWRRPASGPYEGVTVRISTTGKIARLSRAPRRTANRTKRFLRRSPPTSSASTIEDITVVTGDTASIAFGMGTFAARTAVNAGSSAHLAAIGVREETEADRSRDAGGSADGYRAQRRLCAAARRAREAQAFPRDRLQGAPACPAFRWRAGLSPGLEHTAYFTPDQSTYSNGTPCARKSRSISRPARRDPAATS